MYRQNQQMTIYNQTSAAEGDDGDGEGAGESIENPNFHGESQGVEEEDGFYSNDAYVPGRESEFHLQGNSGDINQLSLSFRGQVFVFDAVRPEKVQEVLLMLGQSEPAAITNAVDMGTQNQMVVADIPGRCSHPQREASLNRFRQKRKERCFDKKIRYDVRREVALKMQRKKGQFSSSKDPENAFGGGTAHDSGSEDSQSESSCTHCGTSSSSTPMMRRGPSGPRTLCNACGLFWANKGTLRDLSKTVQDQSLTPNWQDGRANTG